MLGMPLGLPASTSAQEAVGEQVLTDPSLEVEVEQPDPTLALTPTATPQDDDESLRTARRRMGLCGAGIGLGTAGVLLALFVGKEPRPCSDGICNVGRVTGVVISSTVIAGGLFGLVPASLQLREVKRRNDRALRWDPASAKFVF